MIKVYPIKIEAVDDMDESLLFKLETFDEYCATLTIDNKLVWPDRLDELFSAIRQGVELLELKRQSDD